MPATKSRTKKKLGKAPRKIVVLKNKDKKCQEYYKKGDNPIRFPHPFRLTILGKPNSGKTMLIKNILMVAQAKRPKFKEVVVIHGDPSTLEYSDIEPTEIRNTIPEVENVDPDIKKLYIIDDFEFSDNTREEMRKLYQLYRFGSSHRNTSLILSHQGNFSIPKLIKDLSNVFIVFRPTDLDSLNTLGRRIGLQKKEIQYIFNKHLPHYRDSLLVNLIPGAPYKYGKNLFKPIRINYSDSDSESESEED